MIFGSDNQGGASDAVLAGLADAFRSTASAYGTDEYCAAAEEKLKQVFDTDLKAFFVVSGTASNTLALSTMTRPWEGIICHHQAHIILDESSGPALFSGGASLLPAPTREVKLDAAGLATMLERLPNEVPHNIRPAALSISQASECGQVYTPDEVRSLTEFAKGAGLSVHMDGARFANAVAALDCHPADVSARAGVDVLSLGATKNGAVAAEAILFFDKDLVIDFEYQLKRTGHLVSKGRMFGAQFVPWLADEHWLDLATIANDMAKRLRGAVDGLQGMRLAFETQSNESFIILDRALFAALMDAGASMYDWYPDALPPGVECGDDEMLARLVTSFATTDAEIDEFVRQAADLAS